MLNFRNTKIIGIASLSFACLHNERNMTSPAFFKTRLYYWHYGAGPVVSTNLFTFYTDLEQPLNWTFSIEK